MLEIIAIAMSMLIIVTTQLLSSVRVHGAYNLPFRNVRTVYNHFLIVIYRVRARSISLSLMISSVRAHK